MSKSRSYVTANLLPDGNILVMGGEDKNADTADIFDTNEMKIIKTIQLNDKRFFLYNATTLSDGDVFVQGGHIFKEKKVPEPTKTTKLFNSKTYTFRETKPMKYISRKNFSFLLKNGNVLILNAPLNISESEFKKRENMRFQVYNPNKDEYYETKNGIHRMFIRPQHMILENGDILFKCDGVFRYAKDKKAGTSACLYNLKENRFEIFDSFPTEQLFIQLDEENYLTIKPEETSCTGHVYNIKTKEKVQVKNKINRTFYSASASLPKMILLENGNVLIIGVSLKKLPSNNIPNVHNKNNYDYSTYLYNKKENQFYRVSSPQIKIDNSAASIVLKNGTVLIFGGRSDQEGKKIQIYKY